MLFFFLLFQLDFISRAIFQLNIDVFDSAVLIWSRTIKTFQSQLIKRLNDLLVRKQSCWPSVGQLLLFKLLGHLFSVTDYRHSIVGPAVLFLSKCLVQCPVVTAKDAASGLFCCCCLLDYLEGSKRLIPEILSFLWTFISLFAPNLEQIALNNALYLQRNFQLSAWARLREILGSLAETETDTDTDRAEYSISWSQFSDRGAAVGADAKETIDSTTARSFLAVSLKLVSTIIDKYSDLDVFPELLQPLQVTLCHIQPHVEPSLNTEIQQQIASTLERLSTLSTTFRQTRNCLQWRTKKIEQIETKNPRFELDYKFKKDIGGSSSSRSSKEGDKVKLKQLTRQYKREHKAAMRELRRDSDFLEQVKHTERLATHQRQKDERHKNFAWMEEQQATINLQVRKGGGLLKGGGSGIAKRAVRKGR